MIFTLLLSLLGSMIVIRMCENLLENSFFTRSELTKIGTTYFCAVIALTIFLPRSNLWSWFAVFAPIVILAISLYALVLRRKSDFRERVGEALALVSLKMKSGLSFRQALSEVVAESDPKVRAKLSEISAAVVFSQQHRGRMGNRFVEEVIEELRRVDRQPHMALRRLSLFRDKLRTESDFRRRSGQVLARIRAQSLVMTGLYLAVAGFVAWKFGFQSNARFFVMSVTLFSFGSFWIWSGGRKLKWKV